jgi:hypothetical protein
MKRPRRPREPIPTTSSRHRLDPKLYARLLAQVLRRDSYRCQCRGTKSNLEAHHKSVAVAAEMIPSGV